jgi:hypothetical protein
VPVCARMWPLLSARHIPIEITNKDIRQGVDHRF